MLDLIGILAIYYACNAAAAQYQLPSSEAAHCSLNYEAVKLRFLTSAETDALVATPGAERATGLRAGYLRFKDWETANPGLVERLRAGKAGG